MRRAIIACLALAAPLAADMLSFDGAEEWAQWQQPLGLIQIGEQGQLTLVKFRKDINLVEDAHRFTHETRTRGDAVAGGLWQAGSNPDDAPLAIDGDPTTYWQPSPDDAREDWFITIDLGRAALAREIRLKFPDQEGVRPFRQFRVFTTSGVRISATEDLFLYRQVFRTTAPNAESEIAIPLRYAGRDSALVIDPDLDLTPEERNHYRLIQYIQIVPKSKMKTPPSPRSRSSALATTLPSAPASAAILSKAMAPALPSTYSTPTSIPTIPLPIAAARCRNGPKAARGSART